MKVCVCMHAQAIPEPMALRWRDSMLEYLLQNRQWVRPPVVHPRYWSQTQIAARENPRLNVIMSALNSVWHSGQPDSTNTNRRISPDPLAAVDLRINLSYCDRVCIGKPCSPYVSTGSAVASMGVPTLERWLDPKFASVYKAVFAGKWETHDPFNAGVRAAFDESGGDLRPFRPWHG